MTDSRAVVGDGAWDCEPVVESMLGMGALTPASSSDEATAVVAPSTAPSAVIAVIRHGDVIGYRCCLKQRESKGLIITPKTCYE